MRVLFLCSDNASTSLIAEAVLNHVANRRFHAFSAGVHPAPSFNPLVLDFLAMRGLLPPNGTPRSWREISENLDFVITLSPSAASLEAQWPGHPVVAHWVLAESIDAGVHPLMQEQAIRDTFWELMRRIKIFASLRLEKTTRRTLQQRVEAIHAWQ